MPIRTTNNIPGWLDGLDTRIAKVLVWRGFNSVDELVAAVNTGVHIPRIREYSLERIRAWLAARNTYIEFRPPEPVRIPPGRKPTRCVAPKKERRVIVPGKVSLSRTYDPCRLLDTVLDRLNLKNDAALCRLLGVAPPFISKVRNRHVPVGAALLLRLHEETGIAVRELRELMGAGTELGRASAVKSTV